MKVCLVFMCLLAGSLAIPILDKASQEWKNFKAFHKKAYRSVAEEMLRLKIYLQNKVQILAHNLKFRSGLTSFKAKMNSFGDLIPNELKIVANGFKLIYAHATAENGGVYTPTGKPLPPTWDNRQKNLVNTPRDQGTCGSCWTFSTTGAIEGQLARKTGKLIPLSQQNLLDCSWRNGACNGGVMDLGFLYVRDHGITDESSYPYTKAKGSCNMRGKRIVTKVKGFTDINKGSEADLQDAIVNVGPVAVAIDATSPMLKFYESGIFSPPASECRADRLNHGVLAVGYGKENGKEYWIVKNSWGTGWGENGYFRLWKNGQNLCGIASMASFPNL